MTWAIETAARTVWGEARGEPFEGQLAVAHVIVNRLHANRWGHTLGLVCMAPYQFSCWNFQDPNRALILGLSDNDPALTMARAAVMEALTSTAPDPTKGALFYQVVGTGAQWSIGHTPCYTVGHHEFFNDVS